MATVTPIQESCVAPNGFISLSGGETRAKAARMVREAVGISSFTDFTATEAITLDKVDLKGEKIANLDLPENKKQSVMEAVTAFSFQNKTMSAQQKHDFAELLMEAAKDPSKVNIKVLVTFMEGFDSNKTNIVEDTKEGTIGYRQDAQPLENVFNKIALESMRTALQITNVVGVSTATRTEDINTNIDIISNRMENGTVTKDDFIKWLTPSMGEQKAAKVWAAIFGDDPEAKVSIAMLKDVTTILRDPKIDLTLDQKEEAALAEALKEGDILQDVYKGDVKLMRKQMGLLAVRIKDGKGMSPQRIRDMRAKDVAAWKQAYTEIMKAANKATGFFTTDKEKYKMIINEKLGMNVDPAFLVAWDDRIDEKNFSSLNDSLHYVISTMLINNNDVDDDEVSDLKQDDATYTGKIIAFLGKYDKPGEYTFFTVDGSKMPFKGADVISRMKNIYKKNSQLVDSLAADAEVVKGKGGYSDKELMKIFEKMMTKLWQSNALSSEEKEKLAGEQSWFKPAPEGFGDMFSYSNSKHLEENMMTFLDKLAQPDCAIKEISENTKGDLMAIWKNILSTAKTEIKYSKTDIDQTKFTDKTKFTNFGHDLDKITEVGLDQLSEIAQRSGNVTSRNMLARLNLVAKEISGGTLVGEDIRNNVYSLVTQDRVPSSKEEANLYAGRMALVLNELMAKPEQGANQISADNIRDIINGKKDSEIKTILPKTS